MDAPTNWIYKRVALVTLISIIASIAITYAMIYLITGFFDAGSGLAIAIIAPALIAPISSYQFISLSHRLQLSNQQLTVLSEIDSLTGALNRRRFLELSEQQLSLAARHGYPTSLLVLDFDHFKLINDRHGHATGDRVLIVITQLIQNAIRDTDLLGRIGGEEFALLLPHTARQGALLLAERIISVVRSSSVSRSEVELRITLSIGGATSESSQLPLDELLSNADEQLYQAKQNGRDRYEIASTLQNASIGMRSVRS